MTDRIPSKPSIPTERLKEITMLRLPDKLIQVYHNPNPHSAHAPQQPCRLSWSQVPLLARRLHQRTSRLQTTYIKASLRNVHLSSRRKNKTFTAVDIQLRWRGFVLRRLNLAACGVLILRLVQDSRPYHCSLFDAKLMPEKCPEFTLIHKLFPHLMARRYKCDLTLRFRFCDFSRLSVPIPFSTTCM